MKPRKGSMVWSVTITHGHNAGVLCYTNKAEATFAAVSTNGVIHRVRLIGNKSNLNPSMSAQDYMYNVLANGEDL